MLLQLSVFIVFAAVAVHLVFFRNFYKEPTPNLSKQMPSLTSKTYKAIVFGSTGAIGKSVVHELLQSSSCAKVTTISRRSLNITHPKLDEKILPNFDKDLLDNYATTSKKLLSEGDKYEAVFNCFGTTRKQAGSAEAFVRIDKHLSLQSLKLALDNKIPYYSIVTSMGSDANSMFLYPKTKGEIEKEVQDQAANFQKVSIYRPALLITPRETDPRPMEYLAQTIAPWFDMVAPAKYKSITVQSVARAMRKDFELALENPPKKGTAKIFENDEIHNLEKLESKASSATTTSSSKSD